MTTASTRRTYLFHEINGPISPFRESIISSLKKQGFCPRSIHCQLRVIANFSNWLQRQNLSASDISFEHQREFFSDSKWKLSCRKSYGASVLRLLDHLHDIGIIPSFSKQSKSRSPVDKTVEAYTHYLRHEAGLAELSVRKYSPLVRAFLLAHANNATSAGSNINAAFVTSYFTSLAPSVSVSHAKSATTAIRSYLRYSHLTGRTQVDLVNSVPTVPNWSLTTVPRSISATHAQQVLDHCSSQTANGLRDTAILLLLGRLGLRSSEIVSLTLDSINWDNNSLSFVGKGGQQATLPITSDVSQALADYLRRARPLCDSRALFLCGNAPLRALASQTTVTSLVRAAIKRAEVQTRSHGAHQFRHALACSMMSGGATLEQIGSVLRHRKSKTTRIYAKVDIQSLRKLSLPLPGAVQ